MGRHGARKVSGNLSCDDLRQCRDRISYAGEAMGDRWGQRPHGCRGDPWNKIWCRHCVGVGEVEVELKEIPVPSICDFAGLANVEYSSFWFSDLEEWLP